MKTIIVMPAYNAEKTLEKTYKDIPAGCFDEIILVDDCSQDKTAETAEKLGLKVVRHEKNLGYGGNQKTCYSEALKNGADIVVMLHPDYQYDARLIPYAIGFIKQGICDMILGSRIRTRREVLAGGMPVYKYIFNRLLTVLENVFLGLNLSEYHSGFRVYRRDVLESIPFDLNSNNFVFDQQIIIQSAVLRYRIGEVPVPIRYFSEASSIDFYRSVRYGFHTLWVLFMYIMHNAGIVKFKLFERKQR